MAYIHLKRYEQAKTDAEASLLPESSEMVINAKSYYRAALASYELRDYHEARRCFEAARKRNAADPATEREYKRTIARVLEQQMGKYDFGVMADSVSQKHRRLDHASYTANVEVRAAPGRGMGLFASRRIEAGDLVILEKLSA